MQNKVDSGRSEQHLSDERIRILNFPFCQKLWWNETTENCRNCYVAEKHIVSKLSKISIANFKSTNRRLYQN